MAVLAAKDFASLLDDLVAAQVEIADDAPGTPSIPFDYLAVADELHSGGVTVADDVLRSEYGETSTDDFAAFLFEAAVQAANAEQADAMLLPIEPDLISRELGLDERGVDLSQVRRRFAFANHPDRVAPHLRSRALLRMQVANMLIDAAERRAP